MLTSEDLRRLVAAPAGVAVVRAADVPPGVDGHVSSPIVPTRLPSSSSRARNREFAMGREAARRALLDLGIPAEPVGVGSRGEPLWPSGIAGSLSHTREVGAAIVARSRDLRGIGVDVEPRARKISDRILRRICTPAEVAWLAGADGARVPAMAVFCAKEATYKALADIIRRRLGFEAVEFHPAGDTTLAGELAPPVAAEVSTRTVMARFVVEDDVVAACVELPA